MRGCRYCGIVLQQNPLDEIFEIVLEAVADVFAGNDLFVDFAQGRQDAAHVSSERGGIACGLVQTQRIFTGVQLQMVEVGFYLHHQAAELFRNAGSQATQEFRKAHCTGWHVDGDLQTIVDRLKPAGCYKAVIDMPSSHHGVAAGDRVGFLVAAPPDPAASSRCKLIQHDRSFVISPQVRLFRQLIVDQREQVVLTGKIQVGLIKTLVNFGDDVLIDMSVGA
ncbi:hypothetical protein D3C73_499330 [compost metagenome]